MSNIAWCCYEIVCFNVITAPGEENEDDHFLWTEDCSKKKVTSDKSKPSKSTEVSFSFLVLIITIVIANVIIFLQRFLLNSKYQTLVYFVRLEAM